MGDAGVNYVHMETLWRQRLEEEERGDKEWHKNWSFLANKQQSAPRGFSTVATKYAYGGTKWTLRQSRVPDNSEEGMSAAVAELAARKRISTLTWQTPTVNLTKPCEAKGAYTGGSLVQSDTSGVPSREAALLMRTHHFQTLGDACLTEGLDPTDKYRHPHTASQEVGWRARKTVGNGRPGLEIFGVAEHSKRQIVGRESEFAARAALDKARAAVRAAREPAGL
jgi:hypothetical protein